MQVLVRELVAITGRISQEELDRAKTQVLFLMFDSYIYPSYSSVEVDAADELGIPACHF